MGRILASDGLFKVPLVTLCIAALVINISELGIKFPFMPRAVIKTFSGLFWGLWNSCVVQFFSYNLIMSKSMLVINKYVIKHLLAIMKYFFSL